MSAVIYFPSFNRVPVLPEITMPGLATMVITLQRDHLYKLNFREKARLLRASYTVALGDDADPQTQIEQMQKIHPIWMRVTNPPENAA